MKKSDRVIPRRVLPRRIEAGRGPYWLSRQGVRRARGMSLTVTTAVAASGERPWAASRCSTCGTESPVRSKARARSTAQLGVGFEGVLTRRALPELRWFLTGPMAAAGNGKAQGYPCAPNTGTNRSRLGCAHCQLPGYFGLATGTASL